MEPWAFHVAYGRYQWVLDLQRWHMVGSCWWSSRQVSSENYRVSRYSQQQTSPWSWQKCSPKACRYQCASSDFRWKAQWTCVTFSHQCLIKKFVNTLTQFAKHCVGSPFTDKFIYKYPLHVDLLSICITLNYCRFIVFVDIWCPLLLLFPCEINEIIVHTVYVVIGTYAMFSHQWRVHPTFPMLILFVMLMHVTLMVCQLLMALLQQ